MFSTSQLISDALLDRAARARREASELRREVSDPNKFYSEHNILILHEQVKLNEVTALVFELRAERFVSNG